MGRVTDPISVSVGGREESINVIGRNFGYMAGAGEKNNVKVVVGESECLWEEWVSDSSIRCVLLPSARRLARVRV